MSAGVDITQVLKGLQEFDQRVMTAAVGGVDAFGEHVIGDGQELAPVDTGDLKASGTTLPAEVEGNNIRKTIGFNTDYAAAVHERLDVHHEEGEAKYLETALRNNAPKFPEFVANHVKEEMN